MLLSVLLPIFVGLSLTYTALLLADLFFDFLDSIF